MTVTAFYSAEESEEDEIANVNMEPDSMKWLHTLWLSSLVLLSCMYGPMFFKEVTNFMEVHQG